MESPKTLSIFLCHSSGDKPAVRSLYQKLRKDGYDPWLDEENLVAGQDWRYEIAKAVRSAAVVLVCISNESISQAGFVQKEITYALDVADEQPEGAIFIIPIKLEECDVPQRLQRWQWVNYFDEEKGYQQLVKALNKRAMDVGVILKVEAQKIFKKNIDSVIQRAFKDFKLRDFRKNKFLISFNGQTGIGVSSLINSISIGNYSKSSLEKCGGLQINIYNWFKNIYLANIPGYSGIIFDEYKLIYDFLESNNGILLFVIDAMGRTFRSDIDFIKTPLSNGTPTLLIANRIEYFSSHDHDNVDFFHSQMNRVEEMFGMPVLPISTSSGINVEILRTSLMSALEEYKIVNAETG